MTDSGKQVRLDLEHTESLNVEVNDLDEAGVELEDLVHESRETIIFLNDLIPWITFVSFCLRGSFRL